MVERTVTAAERGQRLDKYIKRVLPNAGTSFLYKMLRKKNITRNHGKADGSEILAEGDVITFYFSEETYAKFAGLTAPDPQSHKESAPCETHYDGAGKRPHHASGEVLFRTDADAASAAVPGRRQAYLTAYRELQRQYPDIRILREHSELLFLEKPSGVLSQKARERDLSLNEWFLGYLMANDHLSADAPWEYTPSICNRLDRNTGGIVICARTLLGSRAAARILRDRSVRKYYRMVVAGDLKGSGIIQCWTIKDPRTNVVRAYDHELPGASITRTEYRALRYSKSGDLTLVEAELVTGKTHQLRVHLAHIGHPILGDPKYGDPVRNRKAAAQGVHSQLLWAARLELPVFEEPELRDLSGQVIESRPPAVFDRVMQ